VRALPLTTSLIALTLLAACQARPLGLPGVHFQLAANDEAAPVPVLPAAKPATGPVLTVNLADFLARFSGYRHVLATIADVEKVVVTVTAADGQVYTQTLSRAAIAAGQTTLAFPGLALGSAVIKAEAFDVANVSLGSATQSVPVSQGVMAPVIMQLPLASSSSSGGSGGGGTPPASPAPSPTPILPADLGATITFGDSIEIQQQPTIAGTIENTVWTDNLLADVAFGASGTWSIVGGINPSTMTVFAFYMLQKYDANGRYTGTDLTVDAPSNLVIDGDGNLWYSSSANKNITKITPSGTQLGRVPLPEAPVARGLAIDPSGAAWVANGSHVTQVSAAGTLVGSYQMTGPVGALAVDRTSGAVWVTVENRLVKLSPAGATLATTAPFTQVLSNDSAGLDVDAAGNVWVAALAERAIVRFGPDGTRLGLTDLGFPPRDVAFDATGQAWVAGGASLPSDVPFGAGAAAKLSPQGQLLKVYNNLEHLEAVMMDTSNRIWFLSDQGRVFRLAP
jgi:streptogramin lyase